MAHSQTATVIDGVTSADAYYSQIQQFNNDYGSTTTPDRIPAEDENLKIQSLSATTRETDLETDIETEYKCVDDSLSVPLIERFQKNTTSTSTSKTSKQSLYYSSGTKSRFRHSRYPSRMSVDIMPNGETRQIIQRLEFFLNVINQICIGFVTIYMSWQCLRTGLAGTALHAWLVTIGFSFLMAEGVLCHYSGNVLTFNYRRSTKTTIHWLLLAVGGSLGVAGALIKMIQKNFLLTSVHGKLGFTAFILCLCSMLFGLSALFSTRMKNTLNPLFNKTLHNFIGFVTFVIALIAQFYGYKTGFFSRLVSADFQILMQVITLVSLVLTSIGPLKALQHKFCNIIRHYR